MQRKPEQKQNIYFSAQETSIKIAEIIICVDNLEQLQRIALLISIMYLIQEINWPSS